MDRLCFVYLLSIVISVSSNPISQLVQSCNAFQPSTYSNPTSIPVVIQSSNTNPFSQTATAHNPAALSGPLGDTLNQVILNKILGNPSLQKIIDPNTKLVNQNGEVQRQISNTNVPNVINNYFIVPPEFFNINDTISKNDEGIDEKAKRPRRRKVKRKLKNVQLSEDDEIRPRTSKRRNQKEPEINKNKRTHVDENESLEIPALDELQETSSKVEESKRSHRLYKKHKIEASRDESNEDDLEIDDPIPAIEKEVKNLRKPKPKFFITDDESDGIETEPSRSKTLKDKSRTIDEDLEDEIEIHQPKRTKKVRRKEESDKKSEDKILKEIDIPHDVSNRVSKENRQTRDSKRNGTKKNPERQNKKEPSKITPFSDEVLKNFFPYMPMGNNYNPHSNYPYNFNQYYKYLDPARNYEVDRNKKRRKNQNRKSNQPNSKTHSIEIKLKPKKKDNATETVVTTEKPKHIENVTASIEINQSTESMEEVTPIPIPMEVPQKVSPVGIDDTDSAESYETFSKLEDLHDFITPELGNEDEVYPMANNGIINDYYPVFDNDVYYNPYVETVKNLEDDRYYYETGIEDKANKDKKKLDRYEEPRSSKSDTKNRETDVTNTYKTIKSDPYINKYDHNEYLDHISKFSSAEHETVKSNDDIMRVKVPPKNTRIKTDIVETVSAGSKVAKYGIQDDTLEDTSSDTNNDDISFTGDGTSYVVAKSLGRPEDYW